jgi:serine/threonine-protein kinase
MADEATDLLASRELRLQEVVASFLGAVQAGAVPDRQLLLAEHPELADDLRAFFEDHDRMGMVAAPARVLAEMPGESDLPQSFGEYEILGEVGRGGMGIVYRARHTGTGQVVALKVILAGRVGGQEDVERLRREAAIASGLVHPNIVSAAEAGEVQGRHYFTMELIDGDSLLSHMPRLTREPQEGVRVLAAVARAVQYAHERSVLHRDLKPANILLDRQGKVYVTDFGLARHLEQEFALSRTGVIVGTPCYMAPEQALGVKKLTPAADVYSLGVMLYEVLTGKLPLQGATPLETLRRVVEERPQPPRALNPDADKTLERICLKCLRKEPRARYRSAGELAEGLESWLKGEPVRERRRLSSFLKSPWGLMTTGLILAALLLVVSYFREGRRVYPVDMAKAEHALQQGKPGEAAELLDRHRPGWHCLWLDYRDPKWHELSDQLHNPPSAKPKADGGAARSEGPKP